MTFQLVDASAAESSAVCLRNRGHFNISVTVKNEGLLYGASKPKIENACEGLEIHQKKEEEYIRVPISPPSPPSQFLYFPAATIGLMIKMCWNH